MAQVHIALASQIPSKITRIQTIPLYGILVTQKSFLLGLRWLSFQHYAASLAHRLVGSRLPPELCDEIGAELSKLHFQDAKQQWTRMKDDPDARMKEFLEANGPIQGPNSTESEKAFEAMWVKLKSCVVAEGQMRIHLKQACIDLLGAEGKDRRYVHLSASLVRPSVSVLVPGAAPYSGGPSMSLANNAVTVVNAPADAHTESFDYVRIRCNRPGSAKRLVQLDDVEASIRGWNQEFVENFVEQLKLDVVTPSGEQEPGGGMKPHLTLLQQLDWT